MGKPAHQIIKRPLLTEKGTKLRETGGRIPGSVSEEDVKAKVFFEVAYDSNKIEIRQAIERVTEKEPSVEEVHQVAARLASVGWPLAAPAR